MTDLHPNWQATDASGDEQALPVQVREKPKTTPLPPPTAPTHPPRMRRLSRQPAAIAGMLLAVSIGFSLFFGFDRGTETTVRITDDGFSPKAVTVTAGSSIRWINESSRTHVLQSDALCTQDEECFSTRSIAPGESAILTITPEFHAGTYGYYSISTQGMEASITVLNGKTTPSAVSKTAAQQNLAQTVPFGGASSSNGASSLAAGSSSAVSSHANNMAFALPTDEEDTFMDITSVLTGDTTPPAEDAAGDGQSPLDFGDSSSAPRGGGNRVSQLPVNPYTVNSTRTHPFDAQGKPITAGGSTSSSKGALHGSAPRPLAQPSTGPALWITLFGSFGLLFLATRHLLKRVRFE